MMAFGLWYCVELWINFDISEELIASICRVTGLAYSAYWSDLKKEVSRLYKKVCKDCGKPETWRGQRE